MKLFATEDHKESTIQESITGTYVGVRFSDFTLNDLQELQELLRVPNRVPREEFHTTVLYSRNHIPNLTDIKYNGYIPSDTAEYELEVFVTKDSGKRCLVLKFQSTHLENLHKNFIENHNASHDYPAYVPHITLSYDIGDMEVPTTKVYFESGRRIEMVKQYTEDLKL